MNHRVLNGKNYNLDYLVSWKAYPIKREDYIYIQGVKCMRLITQGWELRYSFCNGEEAVTLHGSSCRFERVNGKNKYTHNKKEIDVEQYDLIMELEKTKLEAGVKDNSVI